MPGCVGQEELLVVCEECRVGGGAVLGGCGGGGEGEGGFDR